MNQKIRRFSLIVFCLSLAACQKISVPKDAQVIALPPLTIQDDISKDVGEYIRVTARIEIPYQVQCDQKIEKNDACPLYVNDFKHIVNGIVGLNKNNVTTSGKIIYSSGETVSEGVFGGIPVIITGFVRQCTDQDHCVVDAYQLDGPAK